MIRPATADDLSEIAILWKQMVLEKRPSWFPDVNIWMLMAKQLMATDIYTLLVGVVDGKIVGFVDGMIFVEPSTGKKHGVGQHFYVIPDHRGMIGGLLYKEIVYEAVKNNVEILEFFSFPEEVNSWFKRGYSIARCLMRREINV